MKQTPLLFTSTVTALVLLSQLVIAAPDIDAAVRDICKCGFPPSSSCIGNLAKKYPAIDRSRKLQDQVMRDARAKCGIGSPLAENPAQDNSVPAMVGNKNLDLSKMPAGIAEALKGINKSVKDTSDCSTELFNIAIPKNWQCRKQNKNAQDVTLHTNGNKLNVSVGKNQGRTSCSVIPICTSEDFELSKQFNTKLYKNSMAGTHEYAGAYNDDKSFKLTITANTKPTGEQLTQIRMILDSFELQ